MWWRAFLGIEGQTPAEKRAAAAAMNLFFGALIGANLGSLDAMSVRDYTLIAAIICMIVLYIQLAPVARKRWTYVAHLLALLVVLYFILFDPLGRDVFEDRPAPTPHLFVTICLWLVSVATVEFRPVTKLQARDKQV
jgi:hypothetical protein